MLLKLMLPKSVHYYRFQMAFKASKKSLPPFAKTSAMDPPYLTISHMLDPHTHQQITES